ncbi:MAG: polyprenyl synthetase family protein [Ignavibacteria bacterium]|jgi:geranylgeranyl diphosphate synthase type II|nr:polyprenyl synthetase family protein [Ignavibacteria bacterium]
MNFKEKYGFYKNLVEDKLLSFTAKVSPAGIYDPMRYILDGGGKRIRPMLLILSCEAAGGKAETALDAAAAIEILHNFTLVHDDIMDNADTRRGRETIHNKWDRDTAILAGDGLLGYAYKSLLRTKSPRIQDIANSFTEAIIEVCEGQSYDKEFETRKKVKPDEYIMMIDKKTSELLKCCAEIGAMIGGGTEEEIISLKQYALNIGLAFQIQDDLLDITADEKEFGKKIGGDLREGKKTFLLLKAIETAKDGKDKELLHFVVENKGVKTDEQVYMVKELYERLGIIAAAADKVEEFTSIANAHLNKIKDSDAKQMLKWFSDMLLNRTS